MRDKFWACWDLKIAITAQVHYTHNYPYWDWGPWDCCSEWGKYYKASVSYAICIPLSNWTYFKPISLSFSQLPPPPPPQIFQCWLYLAEWVKFPAPHMGIPGRGHVLLTTIFLIQVSSSHSSMLIGHYVPPPLNSQVLLVSLDPISPRDVENWELHWWGIPAS